MVKSKSKIKWNFCTVLMLFTYLHSPYLENLIAPVNYYPTSTNLKCCVMFSLIVYSNNIQKNVFGSYNLYLKRHRNRQMHSFNGNQNKNVGYNLVHVNKGNALFRNKIHDLQILIDEHDIDILHLAEANLSIDDLQSERQFPDFDILHSKMANVNNMSRNIFMIKKYMSPCQMG